MRLENIRQNRRNTVPFVGAGISVACGLYTWRGRGLLDTLVSEYLTSEQRKKFEEPSDYLDSALLPCLTGQMTAAIQENQRCLLKMHGSVQETSSMIFSKSQYDEFYSDGKPLPMFLETFFSGKSLLFVGCSLTQDRTMDILAKCIRRNNKIRHYAIVELPQDSDMEIKQRNHLSSMGIDPIYYPEGDYGCVELLFEYLAEDNTFIKEAKYVFRKFFHINADSDPTDDTYKILISILNESYYNAAKDYPELLELNGECLDISNTYEAAIEVPGQIRGSLYNTCINMF